MSKSLKIGIVIGAVSLLCVLIYYFGTREAEPDSFESDDWYMHYDPQRRDPYGTSIMKELVSDEDIFDSFEEMSKELEFALEDNEDENDIYFFIGDQSYLSDDATDFLLDFVADGNTAFFSAEALPTEIGFKIFWSPDDIYPENIDADTNQYFKFTNDLLSAKRYEFKYIYENQAMPMEWLYYDQDGFDSSYEDELTILGTNTKDQWNFVKVQYGEGTIFFHCNPYVFTNVCMTKRQGFQYAEAILSHIPNGNIYWDRYNTAFNDWDDIFEEGGEDRRSSMDFILKNPTLLWALIILVIGALLYVLFKGKRMQKIIPAAELKENTSMRYVNTLASLYLQERKHGKLIRLKYKTFLNFIAEHYYITTKEPDEKFFEKLAQKSQIEKDEIISIFALFQNLFKVMVVTDEQLIELHKKIEYFYKNCR